MTSDGDFWNSYYSADTDAMSQFVLFLLPWYHYGKILTGVMAVTGIVTPPESEATELVDDGSVLWNVTGVAANSTYYTWERFTGPIGQNGLPWVPFDAPVDSDTGDEIGGPWFAPSGFDSCMYLMALSCVYLVLAWYLGQIASGTHGFFFPFTPSYWGLSQQQAAVEDGDTVADVRYASRRNKTISLHKLSKSYASSTALKELTLTMKQNEVFCLLGHNGAGKTTAINCLTGLHAPTHGEAFVQGMSVREEIANIQAVMGVCPQHDHLFPELTGKEHLDFWSRFKGVARSRIPRIVSDTLTQISLERHGKYMARTYSGGMKRRLSVGISAMGDPNVVFLDEPSTGLDPLSRRRLWTMIERLKSERVIVLTTHSMEEADVLSDNIGILSHGRLRALGSSMFLKSRFGSGYSISVMCEEPDADAVDRLIQTMLPGSQILCNAAGAITVGLAKAALPLIPMFFEHVEGGGSGGIVKEWGISNTRLEDVFLHLVGANDAVASEEDAGPNAVSVFSQAPSHDVDVRPCGGAIAVAALDTQERMTFEPVVLHNSLAQTPLSVPAQLYRRQGDAPLLGDNHTGGGGQALLEPPRVAAPPASASDAIAADREGKAAGPDAHGSSKRVLPSPDTRSPTPAPAPAPTPKKARKAARKAARHRAGNRGSFSQQVGARSGPDRRGAPPRGGKP